MKIYPLVLVIVAGCLSAAPVFANTYYFALGSDDTQFTALDTDSIKDAGDNIKTATGLVEYNGAAYVDNIKYALVSGRYDCKNRTSDNRLAEQYDASGALIHTIAHSDSYSNFQPVLPGSIAEAELITVCGESTPTNGISRPFDSVQAVVKFLDGYYAYRHKQ